MGRREQHIRALAAELGVHVQLEPSMYGSMFPRDGAPSGWAHRVSPRGIDQLSRQWPDHGLAAETGWIIVYGWNPRSDIAYMLALHELGHHARNHQTPPFRRPGLLEAEGEAWEWAFEQAPHVTLGPKFMLWMRIWSLGSYMRDSDNRGTEGPSFHGVLSKLDWAY
jgi:hypothetical protein